jgi:hypothetical protein|tara:strand:+ start:335 stop:517 length:183 start_codon:yes stop_codon:yes gene_type:complete
MNILINTAQELQISFWHYVCLRLNFRSNAFREARKEADARQCSVEDRSDNGAPNGSSQVN